MFIELLLLLLLFLLLFHIFCLTMSHRRFSVSFISTFTRICWFFPVWNLNTHIIRVYEFSLRLWVFLHEYIILMQSTILCKIFCFQFWITSRFCKAETIACRIKYWFSIEKLLRSFCWVARVYCVYCLDLKTIWSFKLDV